MSDFLSSLLARNNAIEPGDDARREESLRPRPRSRFEPPALGSRSPAMEGGPDEALSAPVEFSHPPAGPPGAAGVENRAGRGTGSRRDAARGLEEPQPVTLPGERREFSPAALSAVEPPSQEPVRAQAQPLAAPWAKAGLPVEPAETGRMQTSGRAAVHRGRLDPAAFPVTDSAAGLASQRSSQERAAEQNIGQGELQKPAPLTPARAAPAELPRQGPLALTPHPAEQAQQPVIHISIGRVEVRAVQASPAQPQNQSRRPNPVMSLEEYLRRRSGGEG